MGLATGLEFQYVRRDRQGRNVGLWSSKHRRDYIFAAPLDHDALLQLQYLDLMYFIAKKARGFAASSARPR